MNKEIKTNYENFKALFKDDLKDYISKINDNKNFKKFKVV